MKKMRIGLIGCGMISRTYLANARDLYSDDYEIVAVADIRAEAAKKCAEEFGIAKVLTPEELIHDPEVDLVLNLTVPMAHTDVICQALEAGKHVYTEKPFGVSREDADRIFRTMEKSGKRVGCAPDTFMSMPVQTALKAIESGYIGEIMGANCQCIHPTHGNENWHPEPFFFYQKGAGPMFDMGAYYLNILISLMGPARSVMCMQTLNFPERLVKTQPHKGEYIHVEVPTHVVSMIKFCSGAVVTFMNTLDVWNTKQPWIEIYGTKGSIILPDPNHFQGDVLISRLSFGEDKWIKLPDLLEYQDTQRGEGLADMVRAIRENRPHRASAEMARHVVDIINAFDDSAASGREYVLSTTCTPPEGRWK